MTTFDTSPHTLVAGIDEAGRGPLAGPVIAAAVILPAEHGIVGLADSKQLTEKARERLFALITAKAVSYAIGRASVAEIDEHNILNASLLAMQRAYEALSVRPHKILVDGNRCPRVQCIAEAHVRGDQNIMVISAASILAKVTRDREMIELDGRYPGYGLAQHKGYPTALHVQRLEALGVSEIHRRSFAPVRRVIERSGDRVP